ncbi:MAG: DUF4007 family protein [Selenomonadaceae bacterium]|nr:DUF4007 family protein [Selenomonadaceae bacterium]
MKFRGHESFFIRKGWLYKGLHGIQGNPELFTSKDAMEELGIGNNMVRSLRYWMQATGIAVEKLTKNHGKRGQFITELGKIIWEYDKFMEEIGTWWLIHYNLVKNQEFATTWYTFFNKFKMREFQKLDILNLLLKEYPEKSDSIKTLESDIDCLISTYISRYMTDRDFDPESNMNSPLSELGLLEYVDKKKGIISHKTLNVKNIPILIVLAIIYDIYDNKSSVISDEYEISINKILLGNENICGLNSIFQIDMTQLLGILYELENNNFIRVIRTGGLDVIHIPKEKSYCDCIKEYYDSLIN